MKLILARCIILDILRLSDSTYLLMSATPFKKANNINGFFYSELMCSQNIVNKIVNTKLNSHMPAYVFLVVKYDYYKTIDFSNSVDGNGEESYDYDINFEYTYAHRAVGTCFDIEYDPQFDGFLDSY
jgi:hypothetical protein